ncbi:hypothetical protein G3A_12245 [Bacillus sp. 17376]|nr:hypothetical protein G3A_12245 [Bacillus sp. 17376]
MAHLMKMDVVKRFNRAKRKEMIKHALNGLNK